MKKILFIFIFAVSAFSLAAQTMASDKLFDKYSGKDGFTTVYITKYMFGLFSMLSSEDKEYKDFEDATSKLQAIKILTVEDSLLNLRLNFYTELMKDLPIEKYKELMVIKSKGQDLKFLIDENNGRISELLMISGGPGNNFFISMQGDIDLKTISKLSKSMNIQGMENLEKINDKKEK